MKIRLIQLLFFILALFPKIDVIKIAESGLRIEDVLTALIVILIIKDFKSIIKNQRIRKISILFMIYIFVCLVSTALGTYYGYINILSGILFVLRKVEYFVLFYFGFIYFKYKANDFNNMNKVINFIVIFHFLFCMLQILGVIGSFNSGMYFSTLHQGRITSIFNGSYEFSAFLLFLASYYIADSCYNNFKTISKSNIFYFMLVFILIFLSNSRISLIILIFLCFLGFIKKYKVKCTKKTILYIFCFFVAFSSLLVFLVNCDIFKNSRFATISINGYLDSIKCALDNKDFDFYLETGKWFSNDNCYNVGTDASFNLRFNHWAQLLDGFIRHPFLGLGPSITTEAADGNYIRILSESGLVGFILWLILIIYIFKFLQKDKKFLYFIKLSFFSILIGALFIDLFEASRVMPIFWLLLGWGISYNEKY